MVGKLKKFWVDLPRDAKIAVICTPVSIVNLILGAALNLWVLSLVGLVWGIWCIWNAIDGGYMLGMKRDAIYVYEMEKTNPQAVLEGQLMLSAINLLSPEVMETTSNSLRLAAERVRITQMPDGKKHAEMLLALEKFFTEVLDNNLQAIDQGVTREVLVQPPQESQGL